MSHPECGGTHALVVYGGGSAVRSGLLGRCTDSLKAADIPHELLGGVQPNPRLSRVREGIALAKETGADFLLAIGGGSVIDTAKAIGYALANPNLISGISSRARLHGEGDAAPSAQC